MFLRNTVQEVQQSGVVASIFNFFQGRATAFALVFSGVGIALAFRGKLDSNYALFVTAIQTLVVAHSFKEDINEQRIARMELDKMKAGITSDLESNSANNKKPNG